MEKITPQQQEQKRLKFSFVVVVMLMLWGLAFNEITDSNIVELDAGSYIISGIIGLVTIYVSGLQARPVNRAHPLGYTGFVPILNLIRSLMIILICLKAIGESIGSLSAGPPQTEHAIVFLYAGVTLVFNTFAFFYIRHYASKTNSALLRVDALEWKIDIVYNLSILVSFLLSYGLSEMGYVTLANRVDPVFCILLSIGMSLAPLRMFRENIRKLSVTSVDKETHKLIIHRFHAELPLIDKYLPFITAVDVSGILWVELQVGHQGQDIISPDVLTTWEKIGCNILGDVNPHHHLTFRFTAVQA